MNDRNQLKYTEDHQWVRLEGDEAIIGITDFAQDELGDIVFVELPSVGAELTAGEPFGSVESVKTVSEMYAPLSGVVVAVNDDLESKPEKVNTSCYDEGWMIKIKLSNPAEKENLWDYERYMNVYSE